MSGFRDKMQNAFVGRNGADELGRMCGLISMVAFILSMICGLFSGLLNTFFFIIGMTLLFYCFFRMFSANVAKRRQENAVYLQRFSAFQAQGRERRSQREAKKVVREAYKATKPESKFKSGKAKKAKSDAKNGTPEGGKARTAATVGPDSITLTCDKCGQSLKIPRGKGTIKVTCPKCKNTFTMKS